jgi:hypothetical protein
MWRLFRKPRQVPQTVPQAVALLKSRLSPEASQALRLITPCAFESHPPPAGVLFCDLGLDDESGAVLLRACGTSSAEDAAVMILRALQNELLRTATAAELASDDAERRLRDAALEEMAAKDALLTNGRCPWCNRPCASYRATCKYCERRVHQGTGGTAAT